MSGLGWMKSFFVVCAAVAAGPFFAARAEAATVYTWTTNSVATQDWSLSGNWDTNGVYAGGNTDELVSVAERILGRR